ncbi:hypothetical protein CPB97_008459 [Podila verticillata]|nr:hypothetical protein CPB97_008459 [Podila verticillata]
MSSHHSHGHPHHKPTNSTTPGQGALSDALTASVLPVGTATPGAPVAHSLASAPGKAPSTIPSTAPSGASASSNKVIVVFKAGTPAEEIEAAVKDCESKGGKITHRYNAALLGFAAEMPDTAVQTLTVHPHVDYVEPDGPVSIYAKNLMTKK